MYCINFFHYTFSLINFSISSVVFIISMFTKLWLNFSLYSSSSWNLFSLCLISVGISPRLVRRSVRTSICSATSSPGGSIKNDKDEFVVTLELPEALTKYCIYKGSIALNGVSLTIATIDKNIIDIWLIPHTLKHTTFNYNKVGDYVNVETDIVGKYIENFQKSEIWYAEKRKV